MPTLQNPYAFLSGPSGAGAQTLASIANPVAPQGGGMSLSDLANRMIAARRNPGAYGQTIEGYGQYGPQLSKEAWEKIIQDRLNRIFGQWRPAAPGTPAPAPPTAPRILPDGRQEFEF